MCVNVKAKAPSICSDWFYLIAVCRLHFKMLLLKLFSLLKLVLGRAGGSSEMEGLKPIFGAGFEIEIQAI